MEVYGAHDFRQWSMIFKNMDHDFSATIKCTSDLVKCDLEKSSSMVWNKSLRRGKIRSRSPSL